MHIPLNDAKPGMVLSEDVGLSGDVLLSKSEVLDETLITLLQGCGITSIDVAETTRNPRKQTSFPDHPDFEAPADSTFSDTSFTTVQMSQNTRPTTAPRSIPPEIQITTRPDNMSATLRLNPTAVSTAASVNADIIRDALNAFGIRHGIDEHQINDVALQWAQEQRSYEIIDIARGTPPIDAVDGEIEIPVSHTQIRSECDAIRQLKTFGEVHASFPALEIVGAGATIAQQVIKHPAIPGTDIFGNPISPPPPGKGNLTHGENVKLSNNNRTATAISSGIVFNIDGTIGVIPVDPDGTFTIEISSDQMTARCRVTPPGPGGKLPDQRELMQLLRKASVHEGISESDIETLMSLCNRGAYPAEPFVVARGLPPENGKDGDCMYLFKTESSFAPAINSDGSADYKSISIVTTVIKGQQLVSLVPPGQGHDGVDVFGKVLHAKQGNPAKLPQGQHTKPDPANPGILCADIDGIVRITGGLVEVCEGFVIKGNVDYSTGNIDYAKTIQISGDIKAGFTVRAGGDLQVNGTIEDAHITVSGNVLCRCGFLGQGKGLIEAKGDVNISFIKNQCVKSFKSINIAKEAINSTLYSRTSIALHGKPLSAAGGEFHAKNTITAHTVGNLTGIRTLLEVGVDYLMVDELLMIDKQIAETSARFKSVADAFKRYQHDMSIKKQLNSNEQGKMQELTAAFKQARQQLTVLEERKSIVSGKMYNVDDARITIEHAAYPGTLLKFGERHHVLKEELIGPKTIIYSEHEIKIF